MLDPLAETAEDLEVIALRVELEEDALATRDRCHLVEDIIQAADGDDSVRLGTTPVPKRPAL